MKKSLIGNLVTILIKIIFGLGIIGLFFIPKLYDLLTDKAIEPFMDHSIYYIVAFYGCYLISLGIIFTLIIIFKNIYKDSPFKKIMITCLKIIAVLFMCLSVIIFIKSFFIPSVLTYAIIVITFVVSLSFYVLSQVFKVAIFYKEEVDSTI